jgi:hypothetical protein
MREIWADFARNSASSTAKPVTCTRSCTTSLKSPCPASLAPAMACPPVGHGRNFPDTTASTRGGEYFWSPSYFAARHHQGIHRAAEANCRDLYRSASAPGPKTCDSFYDMLNRAVAVAMAEGPRAGLDLLVSVQEDERLAGDHRLPAVRAHLLEMSGDHVAARDSYLAAARQAGNLPQQRYLLAPAARLASELPGR